MTDHYTFKRYLMIDIIDKYYSVVCNIFDHKLLWIHSGEFESPESEEITESIYKNKNW